MTGVEFKIVEDGYNCFLHVNAKLKAAEYKKKATNQKLDNHSKKPEEVNLLDIQQLAATHDCGGKAL